MATEEKSPVQLRVEKLQELVSQAIERSNTYKEELTSAKETMLTLQTNILKEQDTIFQCTAELNQIRMNIFKAQSQNYEQKINELQQTLQNTMLKCNVKDPELPPIVE